MARRLMGAFTLLRIASRNLLAQRRRSAITLTALFVALSLMVVMKGSLNGINDVGRDTLVDETMGAVQVHRRGFLRGIAATPVDLDLPADEATLGRLRALPHVRAVTARIPFGAMASAHDRTAFAVFTGVDPASETQVCPRRFARLAEGAPPSADRASGAALTRLLRSRLAARPGDTVTLLASDGDGVLGAEEVTLSGTLRDAGVFATERKVGFVPLAVAQALLRLPGRATELALGVDDLARVDEVAAAVRAALGPDVEVSTWEELAAFDRDASRAREQAGTITVAILMLVALLGIANTTLLGVRDRTREIGTMLALGMRRRGVLALFVVEAALLGLGGGGLGLLCGGLVVARIGGPGMELPSDDGSSSFVVHPWVGGWWMAGLLLLALAGAVAAALYPAWRASRLRPIEALQKVAT